MSRWTHPGLPHSLPRFLIWNTKSVRRRSTILFRRSRTKQPNECLFTRVRVAKPRHPVPAFAGAFAQLAHRHAPARVRTAHHVAGLWRRPWPADRHAQLAGTVPRLPALARAGYSGIHGLHVIVLSITLCGLHPDAFSEIVGRPVDHASPPRARRLGRSALGGHPGDGLRGGRVCCAGWIWTRERADTALDLAATHYSAAVSGRPRVLGSRTLFHRDSSQHRSHDPAVLSRHHAGWIRVQHLLPDSRPSIPDDCGSIQPAASTIRRSARAAAHGKNYRPPRRGCRTVCAAPGGVDPD